MSDGEIFMLRVPDAAGQAQRPEDSAPIKSWAALWVAGANAQVLAPFAGGDALTNAGWRLDTLRPGDLNPARLNELGQWLQEAARQK